MRKTIFPFVLKGGEGVTKWGRWIDPTTKSKIQVLRSSTIFSTQQQEDIEDSEGEILENDESVVRIGHTSPPPAIFCIGLNYKKHAKETGFPEPKYPVLFLKNPATMCGDGDTIEIPSIAKNECDYECELAAIIRTPTKNVSVSEALDCILGYTVANDVSARRWQGKKGGGQWARAKSFDTFCPIASEIIVNVQDPNCCDGGDLELKTILNGEVMQHSRTSDMIYSVAEIVSFLSQGTTLLPGTVILTGTPEGVGYTRDPPVILKHGDEVTVQLDSVCLRNKVCVMDD